MSLNPIFVIDIKQALPKKRIPKTAEALQRLFNDLREKDPMPEMAVKDNPRLMAFLKGVCHHLPDQESIDAGTHNPEGFYIEDASVWMNSPLLEQEDRSGPMLSMSPPRDNDHYGIGLNVIVHEASKQGLVVWLENRGFGFLPNCQVPPVYRPDSLGPPQWP